MPSQLASLVYYPSEYFPQDIQLSIQELLNETQAPVAMIGSVMLAAMSLACQGLISIEMPDGRIKPCSLYFLTIAESGERKSTVNEKIMKPFSDFEKKEASYHQEKQKEYESQYLVWQSAKKIILSRIKEKQSKGDSVDNEQLELTQHLKIEPQKCKPFRIMYGDSNTTPESLQYDLYDSSSLSAGLFFDEGSMFFDSGIKNELGLFNKLWDGASFSVRRRSKDSFTINDVRMTMSLMLQKNVFRQYLKNKGDIARSNGFLARFFMCQPNSTQGTRTQTHPRKMMGPHIQGFSKRVKELLCQKKNNITNEKEGIVITLSELAFYEYVKFSQIIENEMYQSTGKYYAIKDVASKFMENVLRIAAIFHFFSNDSEREISVVVFNNALHLGFYYLGETNRIFEKLISTVEADATALLVWLYERDRDGKGGFTRTDILQYGPSRVRTKKRLMPALKLLLDEGKAKLKIEEGQNGKKSEYISYVPEGMGHILFGVTKTPSIDD